MDLELIRTIADLFIVPLVGVLWQMNGRMSRMEGEIKILLMAAEKRSNRGA